MHLNQPLIGGEALVDRQRLLAARPRRRDLHVRQRQVLRLDRRAAPQPADQRHGAHRRRPRLLARRVRRRDLHVRRREVPRVDRQHAPQPAGARAWSAPRRARATGCSPATAACSRSATRSSTARPAASHLTSPVVAMQRTPDGQRLLDARAQTARCSRSATRTSSATSAAARTTAARTGCSCRRAARATGSRPPTAA